MKAYTQGVLVLLVSCTAEVSPQADSSAPSETGSGTGSETGEACPISGETSIAALLRALQDQGCLHPDDLVALRDAETERFGVTTLHCNSVYRTSGEDGWSFDGQLERVLDHASVPDVLVLDDGSHLLVYNDVTPYKLTDTLEQDPDRIWRQGAIGQGGVGMAVDRGAGFEEVHDLDLHLEQVQLAVDPDLGVKPDGRTRLVWFGVHTEDFEHGDDPLHSSKPHKFYRSLSEDRRDFSTPKVAVASSEGETGGVDPAVLDLDDGGEILMVGPLDDTAMAWVSEDGERWGEEPDFDTGIRAATVDLMPDPDGGYRMAHMVNGFSGTYAVSWSADGTTWEEAVTVLEVADSFNVTVAQGPERWWLYLNALEPDCVEAWSR